jgi:hypothetical protein
MQVQAAQGQRVKQILAGLLPGGQYVANLAARSSSGTIAIYNAPFPAVNIPGVVDLIYLLDDNGNIMLDDRGFPLLADGP